MKHSPSHHTQHHEINYYIEVFINNNILLHYHYSSDMPMKKIISNAFNKAQEYILENNIKVSQNDTISVIVQVGKRKHKEIRRPWEIGL